MPRIPLALIVVAKLFLWPLTIWLVATGRFRVALRGAVLAVVASALGWAVIGFAGLGRLPEAAERAGRRRSRDAATRSSRRAWRWASGRAPRAPSPWPSAPGCSPLCWREGRRGFDERSLALALAAALALSPIVWLHYFVLLLVPIALARRTFGAIWLIPALFWITPVRGELRAALAHRRRHRGGRAGAASRRRGAARRPRTIPRDDAFLEPREPRRRRARHPVLPGRRLRRLRARRRGHLDRRERRDHRRRLREPGHGGRSRTS